MSEEEVAKLKRVTEESEAAEREGRPTTAEVMGSVQQKHSQDKIMSEAEVAKLKRVTEESEAAEREARPKTSSAGKRVVTLPDAASPPTRSANANADSPPRVSSEHRSPLTPGNTVTLPDIAAPDLRAPMATEVTLTARVTDLRRQLQQERTRYSVRRAHHTKQEGIKAYRTSLDQISGKSTTRLIETTSTERASPAVLLEISIPTPYP